MSERDAEFHCDACGSDTHDTLVHDDTPVPVGWWWTPEGRAAHVRAAVEEAVAPVRALAEAMNAVPDYTPSEYDQGQGRVDQRHMDCTDLLAALPDPERVGMDGEVPRRANAPVSGDSGVGMDPSATGGITGRENGSEGEGA